MNINFNKLNKDKVLNNLNDYIDSLISTNEEYAKKINEYNKDSHIKELMDEIEYMRKNSLHVTSESERVLIDEFRKRHWESCKGNTRYLLEGTGLGMSVILQCTKCKETNNITDTSNW